MSACDAYEQRFAELLDEGGAASDMEALLDEELRGHLRNCAQCTRRVEQLQQTFEALRVQAAEDPPEGWEDRVWEAVRAERAASGDPAPQLNRLPDLSTSSWRPLLAAAAVLASLATAILWYVWQQPDVLRSTRLSIERQNVVRGVEEAALGDLLVVETPVRRAGADGAVGGEGAVEIRIYRQERLLFSCSGEATCTRVGDRLRATTKLDAAGSYQVLVLRGPVVPATGNFDVDSAAAVQSGAHVEIPPPLTVR